MATELSSGAISSILEAVPGIATVLRSPVADAIVNLSRAAAGLAPFDPKYAHELIRYAVRRGLIRSDEGDRVAAEIDGVAPPQPATVAVKPAVPPHKPVTHHAPASHRANAAKGHGHAGKPPHQARPRKKGKPKAVRPRARAKAKGAKARKATKPKKK